MSRSKFTPEESTRLRERIAREAARLIARGKVRGFHTARSRAMRWLSQTRLSSAEIPTQEEVMRELESLTLTQDWDQLSRIQWTADTLAAWLQPCDPFLHLDWLKTQSSAGVVLTWATDRACLPLLEILLRERKIQPVRQTLPDQVLRLEFFQVLPVVIYLLPEITTAERAAGQVQRTLDFQTYEFSRPEPASEEASPEFETEQQAQENFWPMSVPGTQEQADSLESSASQTSKQWGELFRPLLNALAGFEWDYETHPEGNALYHSLQVFALGHDIYPYDEEFLWACLLHDIGYVVDPRNPVEAAVRILRGRVTPRLEWLITELPAAHAYLEGQLISKSLRKADSFEELIDLARCDREGRVSGQDVPTLEEALESLAELSSAWED